MWGKIEIQDIKNRIRRENMVYDTLGFTIHRICNAACSICCFSSNPMCTEKLNINRIKEYIYESKEIDEIKNIAFTGGEPFLAYDDLTDLILYATKAGKKANTVTNGFWATDYDKTYEMLYRLKKCGLDYLSISHDSYHRQFVKTENIRNILKVTTKLNIPTSLAIIKVKDEEVGKIIDDIGSNIYTASIKIGPCLPTGKAAESFSYECFDRTINRSGTRCIYSGNLAVFYDGTIYPCCSQVVAETGLGVGNFEEISLKRALYKIKNNALLYFLRNAKLDFYADYAKEKLGIRIPQYIVNPCELCSILFKKDNINLFHDYVMENIEKVKQEKNVNNRHTLVRK